MDKIPKETKVIINKIKKVVSNFQKYNIESTNLDYFSLKKGGRYYHD